METRTADDGLWRQIVVDRRDAASPYRQIANAIRHKIATHQVAPNSPLPSVRALADQVGVTPATVARAYRQLQVDGLVESQVGVGTVVSDTRRLVYQAMRRTTEELDRSVDAALTPLLQLGYGPAEVRHAVDRRLRLASETRNAVFVSDATVIVNKYVTLMGRELAPLGVAVDGMLLADLQKGGAEVKRRLANTNRVLTALGLLNRVREGLERNGENPPVSIIFTELSLRTIERLTAIAKDKKVLLVSEERYRNSVLGILFQHIPSENVQVLHKLDAATLAAEISDCEVVVHSFGTTDLVAGTDVAGREVIVMEYQVRPDAMEKLRESFGVEG